MARGQEPSEGVVPRSCRLLLPSSSAKAKRLMQFGPDARPLTETNTYRPSNDVTMAAAAHWQWLLRERG